MIEVGHLDPGDYMEGRFQLPYSSQYLHFRLYRTHVILLTREGSMHVDPIRSRTPRIKQLRYARWTDPKVMAYLPALRLAMRKHKFKD